jgi:predicted DNA-binding transcriptional regulator AlpA
MGSASVSRPRLELVRRARAAAAESVRTMKHRFHEGRGERHDVVRSVPTGWPPEAIPRWLNREQSAWHCGMSPSYFDSRVAAGALPQPRVDGRLLHWDRHALDEAMLRLPQRGEECRLHPGSDAPEPE